MASGRKITVEFLGNNSDLDRAMDGSVTRSSKFAGALKKAGKIAGLGLAAGAVIAGKALFDMTKGAIEDEAAQAALAKQLKKAAGATDEQVATMEHWIGTMGEALGVTDDELRPALGKLATATGDVTEAQRLAAIGLDVAAGSGKTLSQVTDALVKAQNGSVGGLGRLGVATKDAEGKTKSFAQIQKDLAEKYQGAAADAADTTAGKMKRLKTALSEAGEEIGYKLIPVVTALAEWFLDKGLPAIQEFGGWMKEHLGPIFATIGDTIGNIFGGGGSGPAGKITTTLTQIKDIVLQVTDVIRTLWSKFGDDIFEYARKAFDNIMQIIGGALTIIQGVVQVFTSLFKGDWQGVWDGIKMILSGALDIILGILKQALNLFGLVWKVAWEGIKALLGAVWDGIKTLVSKGIGALVDYIKNTPQRFVQSLSNLKTVLAAVFHLAMTAGLDKVKDIGDTILGWIKGIPGKIGELVGKFRQVGKDLITAFINGLSGAAGFVSDIAGNIWTALKGMLNAAIDKINAALEFSVNTHVPGVGTISINPPNVPHLAKGGIVRSPTLALIGEDGPEAVVPLGAKNRPRGSLGMGGGQTLVQINLQSWDPRGAGKSVLDALRIYERETGVQLLVTPR